MLEGIELVAPYFVPVLGLVIGSFLNVVVYRVPNGLSVSHPPSACPNCGTAIKPYDNIPIVSWLLLRAKCRSCATPISMRYPLVEASTAIVFYAMYYAVGFRWTLPAFLWFASVTMVLALVDLDTKKIPNRILFPGATVGAVLLGIGALADGTIGDYGRAWLAAIAYFGGFLILALIVPAGFGMGDVKLAFLLGMFTGFISWSTFVVSIFLAVAIGGGVSLLLLVARRVNRKDTIPFGPSLVLGTWLALVYGMTIADSYLQRVLA